jgi:hypothetical protein
MAPAHAQQSLIDSFADDADEDRSGIRARTALAIELDDASDDPAPVYAVVRFRRYYLGTLFTLGVIPAASWDEPMQVASNTRASSTSSFTS